VRAQLVGSSLASELPDVLYTTREAIALALELL
jgi:hypothetical protein